MEYNELLAEVYNNNIEIIEDDIPGNLNGFYIDNYIIIDKKLNEREKRCVLAEELAHFELTDGDIIDMSSLNNRRQERKARNRAYELLVPLPKLLEAYLNGCRNNFEVAEFLFVTEEFLQKAALHYSEKYGQFFNYSNKYAIYFEPLGILKKY